MALGNKEEFFQDPSIAFWSLKTLLTLDKRTFTYCVCWAAVRSVFLNCNFPVASGMVRRLFELRRVASRVALISAGLNLLALKLWLCTNSFTTFSVSCFFWLRTSPMYRTPKWIAAVDWAPLKKVSAWRPKQKGNQCLLRLASSVEARNDDPDSLGSIGKGFRQILS